MSDTQAGLLDEYVKQGGKLIATGKTGCLNERRAPRNESALSCLGLGKITQISTGLKSSVFEINDEDETALPYSSGIGLGYIVPGSEIVLAQAGENTEKYLTLVPEQKVGPPEVCYPTESSDAAGLFSNRFGKGCAVYIPFMAGTFYQEQGYENTFMLLKDVMIHLTGLKPAAEDLTPMCEITVTRQSGRTLIHLINNSGCFGSSFFAPVPLTGICLRNLHKCGENSMDQVRIQAHNGGKASLVKTDSGEYRILLDRLDTYEVITIEDNNK